MLGWDHLTMNMTETLNIPSCHRDLLKIFANNLNLFFFQCQRRLFYQSSYQILELIVPFLGYNSYDLQSETVYCCCHQKKIGTTVALDFKMSFDVNLFQKGSRGRLKSFAEVATVPPGKIPTIPPAFKN